MRAACTSDGSGTWGEGALVLPTRRSARHVLQLLDLVGYLVSRRSFVVPEEVWNRLPALDAPTGEARKKRWDRAKRTMRRGFGITLEHAALPDGSAHAVRMDRRHPAPLLAFAMGGGAEPDWHALGHPTRDPDLRHAPLCAHVLRFLACVPRRQRVDARAVAIEAGVSPDAIVWALAAWRARVDLAAGHFHLMDVSLVGSRWEVVTAWPARGGPASRVSDSGAKGERGAFGTSRETRAA